MKLGETKLLGHEGGRKCAEAGCKREASTVLNHRKGGWSPLWCPQCDEERVQRIDKSLYAMGGVMAKGTKKGSKAKSLAGTDLPDAGNQSEQKLAAIRTQGEVVQALANQIGGLRDELKELRKQHDAAESALLALIRDVPQGELFGQVADETEDD